MSGTNQPSGDAGNVLYEDSTPSKDHEGCSEFNSLIASGRGVSLDHQKLKSTNIVEFKRKPKLS